MKKLNELIIFFLDICYSLKNIHFIKMNEELQNEQLLDHIKAIRIVINMHLSNLEKELSKGDNNIDLEKELSENDDNIDLDGIPL